MIRVCLYPVSTGMITKAFAEPYSIQVRGMQQVNDCCHQITFLIHSFFDTILLPILPFPPAVPRVKVVVV